MVPWACGTGGMHLECVTSALIRSLQGPLLARCHAECREAHWGCFLARRELLLSESRFPSSHSKRSLLLHRLCRQMGSHRGQ